MNEIKTIQAVQCDNCLKLHSFSTCYLVVSGSIEVANTKKGNLLLKPTLVFCDIQCLSDYLGAK